MASPHRHPLDPALAADIAGMNADQMAFDSLRARFVDRQRQLFVDWRQVTEGHYGSAASPYGPADWDNRRALLIAEAAALLFDKPSAGLNAMDSATVAECVSWMTYALAPAMALKAAGDRKAGVDRRRAGGLDPATVRP